MAATTEVYRASTTAPVNLAVIKYWGKRDKDLNLPTNSSLSVTLAQSDLRTTTTASCSTSYQSDSLLLNGSPQDISGARTQACLRELRALRQQLENADAALPKLATLPLRIVSYNNFPTAAGLASSAAGFAALVRAIADLYQLPTSPVDLSRIARQGSGSACRSLFGGYVAWRMGEAADGNDSVAEQVAPAQHWPGMRAVILVISAAKKDVSSTAGMQTTVATSELFATRAAQIVPRRMREMESAVQARDFSKFGELAMRDSNTFHATCADTWPPIYYMNDASRAACRVVEKINDKLGRIAAAYTFDAGPNAVVFYEEKDEDVVLGTFKSLVGSVDGWRAGKGETDPQVQVDERVATLLKEGVSRVILTGVGEDPISIQHHLVDDKGEVIQTAAEAALK